MKSYILQLFVLVLVCLVPFGCSESTVSISDPVVQVQGSSVEMNEAIKTARETFPQFVDKWKSMPSDAVSVKFKVPTDDDGVEHIWFEPIEITDTQITGTCGNDPAKVSGLKLGDVRTFDREKMTDWMILVGDKCYGGYTVRVLAKMQPDKAPPLEFVDF